MQSRGGNPKRTTSWLHILLSYQGTTLVVPHKAQREGAGTQPLRFFHLEFCAHSTVAGAKSPDDFRQGGTTKVVP